MSRLLFITIFLLPIFANANDKIWEWETKDDGVDVYLRAVAGTDTQAFKAVTTMQASKQDIYAKIINVPSYIHWMADCYSATLIKQINDEEYIARFIIDSPWPVQDRDIVFHRYREITATGDLLLKFDVESEHLAVDDEYVRVTKGHGYFLVQDTDQAGMSKVTYEMYVEPAGDLPSWLANAVVTDSPITTLTQLRKLVTVK